MISSDIKEFQIQDIGSNPPVKSLDLDDPYSVLSPEKFRDRHPSFKMEQYTIPKDSAKTDLTARFSPGL